MSAGGLMRREDLERWAEILVPGDLSKLSDAQLLDRLTAALTERRAAIERARPGGPAVPRYEDGV